MSELRFLSKREIECPDRRSEHLLSLPDSSRLDGSDFRIGFGTNTSAEGPDAHLFSDTAQVTEQKPENFFEENRVDFAHLSPVEFADCLSVSIPPVSNEEHLYALQTIRPELRVDFIDSPQDAIWVRLEEKNPALEKQLDDINKYHANYIELSQQQPLFYTRQDEGMSRICPSKSNGWLHFKIENTQSSPADNVQISDAVKPKLYVTIPEAEKNFNLETIRNVIKSLTESGISFSLKIPRHSGQVQYCFDNIVVHVSDTETALKAGKIIAASLNDIRPEITYGADVDGKSYSAILTEATKRVQDGLDNSLSIPLALSQTLEKFKVNL
jgi:hypothetical protein